MHIDFILTSVEIVARSSAQPTGPVSGSRCSSVWAHSWSDRSEKTSASLAKNQNRYYMRCPGRIEGARRMEDGMRLIRNWVGRVGCCHSRRTGGPAGNPATRSAAGEALDSRSAASRAVGNDTVDRWNQFEASSIQLGDVRRNFLFQSAVTH